MSSQDKKSIFNRIKSDKKFQIIIISVISAVLLLCLVFNVLTTKEVKEYDRVTEYVNDTELKLEKILSSVEGAGKVSVAITVESGMETVLAVSTTVKETQNGKETVTTPVIVNGKTVVLKENYPKIVGVLIIAEGATSITVFRKIQQATMSFLDININQIEILTMKK